MIDNNWKETRMFLKLLRRTKRLIRPPRDGNDLGVVRRRLAKQFLSGSGLEIGALHQPLELPRGVVVSYVDRMTLDDLRTQYPDLASWNLVTVDRVDDGETLTTFANESQDFVVANHFLEHTEDPIGTLRTFFRVLKPGGVLYLAIPDKRYTFDCDRPVTTFEHLDADHREGPAGSRDEHYREYARHVHRCEERDVAGMAHHLKATGYSIHFHVWTQGEFLDFIARMRTVLGFDLEAAQKNQMEFIVVLRKHEPMAIAA
jgi:SAM-dependent methyltransferase